ncbi:class II aldolase/adducin family protein [Roseiarcaceae bacterium H3SJ34-1]|uniref:class II aldolase/adducin family protein n=1 Tax=Terripilifer ovatus TaxID=3032367 RepID=UPI003AB920B2|nr:class II aldolase/adducin family protein [Roseiarcaceae bacterium H3SJ34-1]
MSGTTASNEMAQEGVEATLAELARAHRILALNGHVNMSLGHMAWRDPEGRGFWLKRSGLGFEEVGPTDFILLDFNGRQLAGSGKRHAEWPIHAEIMRLRPDVAVTAHSHPLNSAVFSACNAALGGVCHENVLLHDKVAYYRKAQGLITTPEQGRDLADVLGHNSVVLMKNHGVTTCGATIASAALSAIFIERACTAQLLATASQLPWSGPASEDLVVGGPARLELPPHAEADFWAYFGRQLDRSEIVR